MNKKEDISWKPESNSRQNYTVCSSNKIFETIPAVDQKELQQMRQRIRKLMTMHKALYPIDDFDKLYVSRKVGRKGIANTEDSVDVSIWLRDYLEKRREILITAIRNNTNNTGTNELTITKNKNEKKNKSMNIWHDKYVTFHTRKYLQS